MTKLLTSFTNHFHIIMTVIFGLIILYIIARPYYLQFYFENTLGRTALLLFIVVMTLCNPIMGIFATVVFIGLYNSRVIEGLDTMSDDKKTNGKKIEIVAEKKPEPKTTEASTSAKPSPLPSASSDDKKPAPPLDESSEPTVVPKDDTIKKEEKKEGFHNRTLSPEDLNEGRNRMLTIEDYIRKPKMSNQMSFSKYYESGNEPIPNFSGSQGMQSCPSAK